MTDLLNKLFRVQCSFLTANSECVICSWKQRWHNSHFTFWIFFSNHTDISSSVAITPPIFHKQNYLREMGKITARQLTRIHTWYAHKACCLATHGLGTCFRAEWEREREKRRGLCGEEVDVNANEGVEIHASVENHSCPFTFRWDNKSFPLNRPS